MSYLIGGIIVLGVLLLAGKWFVSAEPKTLVRILKPVLFILAAAVIVFLIVTGRLFWVFWILPFAVPLYMRYRNAQRMAKNTSRMFSGGASGMASEVSSEFLEMRLDHDSGDMDGTVRKGRYAQRRLSDLSLEQLLDLYADYSGSDGESARLLAAFLDRMHPDWRENASAGGAHGDDTFAHNTGSMSRAEALRILGLPDDADEAEIKAAHHRLIAGLHPDRGGSAYLAAKINEARDVLLKP